MNAKTTRSATPGALSAHVHSGFTDPIELIPGQRNEGIIDVCAPNILICGEIGAGKSSIINLIAGQKLAPTSDGPFRCTLRYKRYTIVLDGMSYNFWDTRGLDEGTKRTDPATLPESNLRLLLNELANMGGIHLLVYCIHADRLKSAHQRSYDLLSGMVCGRKVPIVLVVTGLEHQRGKMETWWNENEEVLRQCGMQFDAHACVTALDAEACVVQERRSESQRRLRELMITYSRFPHTDLSTRG